MTTLTQAEFDRLSEDIFNKRIGDFLCIHDEANPKWYFFYDNKGNIVQHGGQGESSDAIVRISSASIETLRPRAIAYLEELVSRHDETLYDENGKIFQGKKVFHGVTIELHEQSSSRNFEATIHTGSGCCYDQDEIAYEVMAKLSGVPVYKAVAPFGECHGFVRKDKIDDHGWIVYLQKKQGIKVSFSHADDNTSVCVEKFIHLPQADWDKFKSVMFDYFGDFVKARTGKDFIRLHGYQPYLAEDPRDSVEVDIRSGSSCSFSIKLPYNFSYVSFPRLDFAKDVMEHLEEVFKKESVPS